ncbi:hypothetical protein BC835DRAFT_1012813 [Cytidiella melzeri]|nr:hypothetical protein BC835DRAFT_1012813 [Cytidiella melzeri]
MRLILGRLGDTVHLITFHLTKTPQVWFQNRRAKEKNQAKKIDASLSVTGTTTSASSSSAPAVPTADGTTTSEAESSTASASTDANSESPDTLTTPSPALGEPASASTVRTVRPSLSTLPAVPATTALDEVAYAGDLSAPTSDTDSSPSHVPQAFMTRPVRTNPSAAELLAQRRPSLPILNMHSLPHTIRRMPSGLSGKAIPKGFDPYERRKSVDTMNANMRRLASHPYASQAAQYVHSHGPGGFGHGMSMYGGPQSLHVRRSISHTGLTDLEEGSDGLSGTSFSSPERTHQTPQGRTYYLTPTSTHTHNQAQNRPMLTQRVSMPSFHPDHQHRPSPPSASANGSFAGLSFTDPWHAQSQKLQSASSAIDSPISPHALPPASPGRPAPPLPYNGLMLAQSLSRRYAVGQGRPHEHPQDFGSTMSRYNMSTRSIPAPVPGPLPDAHFSFGVPSSSAPSSNGSSSSTSPVVHDAGLSYGGGRNRAVVEEEADDASAVSSTYDPRSRFGSLASVASTESSWTSAYYSDAEGRKLSVSAPDGYDAERRGSMCVFHSVLYMSPFVSAYHAFRAWVFFDSRSMPATCRGVMIVLAIASADCLRR